MSVALVEVVRGGLVEAIHRGDLAVVDATGVVRASVGDPKAKLTYWRSSAKPFQAIPLVTSGAAARFGMDDADLALCSASHQGEPVHTERAQAILARAGLDASALQCGTHPPLDAETAAALRASGELPNALHNNCSGKHAGMLALAVHLGADPARYRDPTHPVQVAIRKVVERATGTTELHMGVDGCGVPCFGLSVYAMALAFARLAEPAALGEPLAGAARRVHGAMRAHPYLVAGRGRFDTALMEAGAGRIVAKGGASAVMCVAIEGGLGLALKIEDGSLTPSFHREVATLEALRLLGLLDPAAHEGLRERARRVLRNVAGTAVGEVRPAFAFA